MNVLVIVNDQPYGSERPYNALRLATALSKRGLDEAMLIEGARRSTLEELADWALWAETTLTF